MASALRPTRKRLLIGAAVLAVLVLVIVLVLGGGDTTTKYGDVAPGTDAGPRRPDVHPFGETVRLRTSRTTIEVRPTGFSRQPATAAASPSIAIDLSVRNVGREPYLDQPSQAASVVLRGGEEADRIYDPVGGCRRSAPDTVRMWPGEPRRWACRPSAALPSRRRGDSATAIAAGPRTARPSPPPAGRASRSGARRPPLSP